MNQGVIYGANEAIKFGHGQHRLCGQHDVHIKICFQVCIRQCIVDITPRVHNGFHDGSRVHHDKWHTQGSIVILSLGQWHGTTHPKNNSLTTIVKMWYGIQSFTKGESHKGVTLAHTRFIEKSLITLLKAQIK